DDPHRPAPAARPADDGDGEIAAPAADVDDVRAAVARQARQRAAYARERERVAAEPGVEAVEVVERGPAIRRWQRAVEALPDARRAGQHYHRNRAPSAATPGPRPTR